MKIIILGGGISGLATAWYCQKRYPEAQITLLEKKEALGGWIQTRRDGGFLFEEGPRTFPWNRSSHLRELIQELGLENELIFSLPEGRARYLWQQNKLRSLRSLMIRFLPALLWSRFVQNPVGDVSIYDFCEKKFGKRIAETLFDPMTLGIYGGDIHKLSFSSCFPDWEKKGFSFPKKDSLFALKGGMHQLIGALKQQLSIEIVTQAPVEELHPQGVIAQGRFFKGDLIFSALPVSELGRLSGLNLEIPMLSLWRVFFAYPHSVLSKRGFGYLIPTQEKESVLGMIWDSEIFPQQNLSTETRITAMVRDGTLDPIQEALSAAERHLNIRDKPIYATQIRAENAIPQFEVGYREKLNRWKTSMASQFPRLKIVGNYLEGPSVDSCIKCAKESVG